MGKNNQKFTRQILFYAKLMAKMSLMTENIKTEQSGIRVANFVMVR